MIFFRKYNLKNKATSNKQFQQVFSSLPLNDVAIYLGDGPFSSYLGIVILHPTKGTHWVAYNNQNYFGSYCCSPPQKLTKIIIKRNGTCLNSDYKRQSLASKRDFYCAAHCLYKIY